MLLLSVAIVLLAVTSTPVPAANSPVNPITATAEEQTFASDPFDDQDAEQLQIYDPLEPVNRGIFWVNDQLYVYLFKPVAKGLRIIPEPARVSVRNFFSNLATPIRLVNSLLQFKLKAAGTELCRFFVNSTLGVAGFFDIATENNLPKMDEDLGQTLGHYGSGSGPYLVLPIFGPSNLRDGIGRLGDTFLDPLPYHFETREVIAFKIGAGENELSLDKDTYEVIKKHEIDPYLFVRSAYEQNRAAKVKK